MGAGSPNLRLIPLALPVGRDLGPRTKGSSCAAALDRREAVGSVFIQLVVLREWNVIGR